MMQLARLAQLARLPRRARLRPAQQLALARLVLLVLVAFLGCLAPWTRRALLASLAQPVVIALPV